MPLWREVLRLRRQQQSQLREALAPTRNAAEFVARRTEELTVAIWGMTREQYRTLSPEDRALLFGSPESPTPPPASEPASTRPSPVVQPTPADPEPGRDASVTEHDAWMLRKLTARYQAASAAEKAKLLTRMVQRAHARQTGSTPKAHRNRLRRKLQA